MTLNQAVGQAIVWALSNPEKVEAALLGLLLVIVVLILAVLTWGMFR